MEDDLMPIEKRLSESMRQAKQGACLEGDALLELADRGRKATNYSGLMAHVASCRTCRESLKLLREVELGRRQSVSRNVPWLPRVGFGLAAAVLIVALLFMNRASNLPLARSNGPANVAKRETPKPRDKANDLVAPQMATKDPTDAPRLSKPHRRHRKSKQQIQTHTIPEIQRPAEPELWASCGSTIEGEVQSASVVEGEVENAPVLTGEVVRSKPPTENGKEGA